MVVIPSDRHITFISPYRSYTFTNAGWYVPDATMLDIRNALSKARIQMENK